MERVQRDSKNMAKGGYLADISAKRRYSNGNTYSVLKLERNLILLVRSAQKER